MRRLVMAGVLACGVAAVSMVSCAAGGGSAGATPSKNVDGDVFINYSGTLVVCESNGRGVYTNEKGGILLVPDSRFCVGKNQ